MSNQRLLGGLVALVLLAIQLLLAPPTYACSTGPEFNPVAEADLIVGGRIVGWEELPGGSNSPFTPIRLTLEVDQHLKGAASATVTFVDQSSVYSSNGQIVWAGASGSCGAFDSDPTGQYVVLGLDTAPDGGLASNLLLTFFNGAEPSGEAYTRALERLTALAERLTPTAEPATPSAAAPQATATPEPATATPEPAPQSTPTPADPAPPAVSTPAVSTLLLGAGLAAAGLAAIALRRRRA
jgi:hypothetical protein